VILEERAGEEILRAAKKHRVRVKHNMEEEPVTDTVLRMAGWTAEGGVMDMKPEEIDITELGCI
jgi:hypothetical protein